MTIIASTLLTGERGSVQKVSEVTPQPLNVVEVVIPVKDIVISYKDLNQFTYDVGMRESSNRYDIVNRFGYMGKYQFGRKTLNQIGYKNVSNKRFLNTPEIQEEAMIKLLRLNKHTMRRYIKKHNGKRVNGVMITESGILASTHLLGPSRVRKWLRNGKEQKDGLGTSVVEYMTKFGGYDLVSLN